MSEVVEILRVRSLESGYGPMQVLWGVDLDAEEGSLTLVIGPNGAGKTTLLNTIMGILRPWRGRIEIDGRDITGLPVHRRVDAGLAIAPEGRQLFPDLTVWENLALGAYTKRARERLAESLELVYTIFPILRERRGQRASTLSGGEQQMLSIARALMTRPRILLVDEPSAGLAPKLAQEVVAALARLRDEARISILLVEQNVRIAVERADKIYRMSQGRIYEIDRESLLSKDLKQ